MAAFRPLTVHSKENYNTGYPEWRPSAAPPHMAKNEFRKPKIQNGGHGPQTVDNKGTAKLDLLNGVPACIAKMNNIEYT